VEGQPDPETGMVIDFNALTKIVQESVINQLDHRLLNDLIPLATAENISIWIWDHLKPELPALVQLEIFETTGNCVIYRGESSKGEEPGGRGGPFCREIAPAQRRT
jgi:6-pyruvoyltetrahydropterin/6-carboxytetrahydropterin synthase